MTEKQGFLCLSVTISAGGETGRRGHLGGRGQKGGALGGLGVEASRLSLSAPVHSHQDAVLSALRAWEAQNLRALREQEARALREQEQEQLLTYSREDAYSAVCVCLPSGRSPTACAPGAKRHIFWCPGHVLPAVVKTCWEL